MSLNIERIKKEINCSSEEKTKMAARIFNDALGTVTYDKMSNYIRCQNCGEAFHEDSQCSCFDAKVKHPSHYTSHPSGIECIEITKHHNFAIGNAIKYLWRAGLKGDAILDLEKAKQYIEIEIERLKDD